MATNITGLPATQFSTPQTSIRLKNAIQKLWGSTLIQLFSQNDNSIKDELDRSFTMLETANVRIKPISPEALNGTDISATVTYDANQYGNITVGLDNIAYRAWTYRDVNQAVLNDTAEQDYLDVNTSGIVRKIERTIIDKMRTSPLVTGANTLGTNGTALNAAVFRRLRTQANLFGIDPTETIFVVLEPTFYEQLGAIPDFANYLGLAMGNVNVAPNETMSSQMFTVKGFYNMTFISSNYYTRAVPATDPVGTAFVKSSMVMPVRKLPISFSAFQTLVDFNGLSMLYTKAFDATKVGGMVVNAKLEVLYGLKEISADINTTGVLQSAPLFNIKGGI